MKEWLRVDVGRGRSSREKKLAYNLASNGHVTPLNDLSKQAGLQNKPVHFLRT